MNVIQAASAVKEEALCHSEHRVLNAVIGPHRPQRELQFQAVDPNIACALYGSAFSAPSLIKTNSRRSSGDGLQKKAGLDPPLASPAGTSAT